VRLLAATAEGESQHRRVRGARRGARLAGDAMSARSRPAAGERLGRTRRRYEGPLGDATEPAIVWQRAEGATVWDADGRAYTDLSSGFGVAAVGHRNPRVWAALHRQAAHLL